MSKQAIVIDENNLNPALFGRTWFDLDEIEPNNYGGKTYHFSTRDNGCVGSEQHGEADFAEAIRLKHAAIAAGHQANIEVVDEWVHISFHERAIPHPLVGDRLNPEVFGDVSSFHDTFELRGTIHGGGITKTFWGRLSEKARSEVERIITATTNAGYKSEQRVWEGWIIFSITFPE